MTGPRQSGRAEPPQGSPAELSQLIAELEAAPDAHAALQRIAALREALDEVERSHVECALQRGSSLAAVGRDLGVSRQSVHRRYGELASGVRASPRPREAAVESLGEGLVLSNDARHTLRDALAEAQAVGDATLGGQHVLLALLRPEAVPVLDRATISRERARTQVLASSPGPGVFARSGDRPDARVFLTAVATEARRRNCQTITPELLLLTGLQGGDSPAIRTLRAIGAETGPLIAALTEACAPRDGEA
jgi:DNA-binding transcriptional MocR family regulator